MSGVAPRPLSRTAAPGRSAAPVRILHLGLGNFFRAHQAWYTHHAADAAEWGIAAFTGRRPGLGVELDLEAAAAFPYQPAYLPVNRLALDGTVHDW